MAEKSGTKPKRYDELTNTEQRVFLEKATWLIRNDLNPNGFEVEVLAKKIYDSRRVKNY